MVIVRRSSPAVAVIVGCAFLGSCVGGVSSGGDTHPAAVVIIEPQYVELVPGATQQFSATVTGSYIRGDISWSLVEATGCGSIDGQGLYQAPDSAATCKVKATSIETSSAFDTATVTVSSPSPSITSFTPSPATAAAGATVLLTAVFAHGSGSVDQGVGAVTSGVPKIVTVNATTTYTLSVTDGSTTVTATATVTVASDRDRFGIKMLHLTTSGGREWFNRWGAAETVDKSYDGDTPDDYYDSNLHYLSSGNFLVYGANSAYSGQMMVTGLEPRIYVRDSADAPTKTWKNVEITLYAKLISADTTTAEYDWASIDTGVRLDHWDFTNDCGTAGYYGRMLFKGYMDFEKEISHNAGSYKRTTDEPNGYYNYWHNGMPLSTWIGYKFVVRNNPDNTKVQLELYLDDTTDGANGGTWTQMISFEDYPGWSSGMATKCSSRAAGAVLTDANYSVMVRPDALDKTGNAIYFKKFSVREIDPLP